MPDIVPDPSAEFIRAFNEGMAPRPPRAMIETTFGRPIDFGHPTPIKRRHVANELLWGAWGGIAASIIATIAAIAGQLEPGQTVWGFGMGGLFWMMMVARIWNWLGRRH